MKMILKSLTTLILSFSAFILFAQNKSPRWLPEKGYWVIESSLIKPQNAIVHFYNDENKEVYKEEVKGYGKKLNKRKYRMQLKQMLDKAVTAWTNQQPLRENEGFFIALLQNK
jgi:hypothetical protein